MAKTQIKNYVFKPGIGANDNRYPNAYGLLSANKAFIQKEATAWIQDQVDANVSGFVGYTYNQAKCERDVGYVVDAYLSDLRYGGNENLRNTIKYYWDRDVAQVDGDRQPEIQTHTFIGELITDYIFTNILYSASNNVVTQTRITTSNAEAGAVTDLSTLVLNTVAVITNGLSSMPAAIPTGVGTIKIQGRFGIDEILLITNSTKSEVLYNFTNLLTGASVSVKDNGADVDFVKYLQTTDAVTTIKLNYNTSAHSSTDNIQIFIEEKEVRTRPYDFGTDAIERNRTADPVSMLDADFEYGLQPTKWSAIGTMRGYPSVYEIPGTDQAVSRVVTDASLSQAVRTFTAVVTNSGTTDWLWSSATDRLGGVSGADRPITLFEGDRISVTNNANASYPFFFKLAPGTGTTNQVSNVTNNGGNTGTVITWTTQPGDAGTYYYQNSLQAGMVGTITVLPNNGGSGVGQSLITVTTVGTHGFDVGTPVSVKALENSIAGASRAEGTFIIINVPSPSSFQYFAKAKVGTASGQVLSTGYTQLRQAGFYTGASIGSPNFIISSNGSSGTMFTQLGVLSGETVIAYDGQSPEVGSPLSRTNIPLGSQVTGVIDNSAGGGTYITPLTNSNTPAGQNQMVFQSVIGVVENLAIDRGDGNAIYIIDITGNTATFNGNFVAKIPGNKNQYVGLNPGNDIPSGQLAQFDISYANDSSFTYVIDAFANDGIQYEIGDSITILGTELGGASPANDATVIVTEVGSANSIAAADISGTHFNNDIYLTNQPATFTGGVGVDAGFDIEFLSGTYTSVTVTSGVEGSDYKVGDVLVIAGSVLVQSIVGTNFDLYISVDSVDVNGGITGITFAGTAPQLDKTYTGVSYTSTTASGTGAVVNVRITGASYQATFTNQGINYLPTETITVAGTALGGVSPANDLTITIDNVGGTGNIIAVSTAGVTYNGDSFTELPGNNRNPLGATFNISQNTNGAYVVNSSNPGTLYNVGMELVVAGSVFGGTSPANDLTITVDSVVDLRTGVILTVSSTGAGYIPTGAYTNISGDLNPAIGNGAEFSLIRENGNYSSIEVTDPGEDYQIGNRLAITGAQLDGVTPLNDILIRVTGVSVSGGITNFVPEYIAAGPGAEANLISTVTMTEPTTGTIAAGQPITFSAIATIEAQFETAHGLVPGDTFITSVSSDNGVNNHNLAAGSYIVTSIPSITTLQFQARTIGSIDATTTEINGDVYPKPDSFFIHRPFDGGVQLGTGGPQHGAQAIRQSKKYIRYQSGKGIMYTTGALFAPSYDLRSVVSDGIEVGSEITIVTDDNDHGLQIGGIIRLLGVQTPGYNSGSETAVPPIFDYEVIEIVDERTFKVLAQRRLGATTAVLGFGAQMSVVRWHGATVRSGIFDDQNGIFWEYDGTQISVVQRTGTYQIAGTVSIQIDKNLLSGTNTRFRDQLKAGDRIIIRGMTHVVSHVISQTSLTVTPDWRGVTNISGVKAMLIFDKKTKQIDFNLDRLDGTGPSGYDIDIAKMQMIGIQYSWYGAGFIDFMLRGSNGNFVFAHRMRNSNINTEAFMRSGNLPVRYEVTNEGPNGRLAAGLTSVDTDILLEDGSFFPSSGTLYIDNEIINYTGRTGNTLTGAIRGATFTNFQSGAQRSYTASAATTHTSGTGVILISNTITPLISHWGSAFITDGGFDEDRGYIFSYSETAINVTTTKQTAFMIRLAPSVSNAIVGDLGERELLNRAQLLLQGIELTSDTGAGGIIIEGVLNPQNYPLNPDSVGWTGLSGVAQGGQPSFAQIAAGGSIEWSTGVAATTANATSIAALTAQINSGSSNWGNNNYINISANDYAAVFGSRDRNLVLGKGITGTGIPANSIIQDVYISPTNGDNYGWFYINNRSNGVNANTIDAYTITYNAALVNRNFAYLTKSSFDATGAKVGTEVSAGASLTVPANTLVNRIIPITWAGTDFYEVQFNNTLSGTLALSSGTITFRFIQPPYAQPGETVFSFIAVPGERSMLDLSNLKELTNTPLGGRGTFPNGPDVLAINIFKVSGTELKANLTVRWGEAQA